MAGMFKRKKLVYSFFWVKESSALFYWEGNQVGQRRWEDWKGPLKDEGEETVGREVQLLESEACAQILTHTSLGSIIPPLPLTATVRCSKSTWNQRSSIACRSHSQCRAFARSGAKCKEERVSFETGEKGIEGLQEQGEGGISIPEMLCPHKLSTSELAEKL